MKKGFTLAELLGVTVLLALVVVIAYPVMLNIFEEQKDELDTNKKEIIENVAINYVKSNLNDYPYREQQNSCVFLKTLVDNNLIPYEVEDAWLNRIIKVNMGSNNKYSAEVLDAGQTCTAYGVDVYEVKSCSKKDSAYRYRLVDNRTQYYIKNKLIKQIDHINAENDSDLALFKIQMNNYDSMVNVLQYKDGILMKMDKNESYFTLHAEFDVQALAPFTEEEKNVLINAPIFYQAGALDTTCNG